MMRKGREIDWLKFWIHFGFGLPVGALIGVGVFSKTSYASSTSESNLSLILIVAVSALLVGLSTAIFGDELWKQIHKLF